MENYYFCKLILKENMKAVIGMCLTELISSKFGKNKLKLILEEAKLPDLEKNLLPTLDIPDEQILSVVTTTCKIMKISLDELGDMFGEYWCRNYITGIYSAYYKDAKNAKDFLLKMKRIHTAVTNRIPNAKPPDFDYVDETPGRLIMKYYSDRNLQPIWLGCIRGIGLIFNEKLNINIIDNITVEIVFLSDIDA